MAGQVFLAALQPSGWLAKLRDSLGEPVNQKVPDVGIITESLNQIINALTGGYGRLGPATSHLMWSMIAIDVLYFGIMVALGLENVQNIFRKLIAISFWLYFIRDFERHANALVSSLVSFGLMMGGQPDADWRVILDPSQILSKGFELGNVLLKNMPEFSVWGPTDILGAAIAFLLLQIAFFAIAANAYILVVGFYLTLCVAGAFMPFALFSLTREFAMRGVTAVVAHGVHLMLVAIATALIQRVVVGLKFSEIPTMHETWSMVFVMGTLAILAWNGPQRFAQGFMSGSATLGGAEAVSMGAQVFQQASSVVGLVTGAAAVVGSGWSQIKKGADNRSHERSTVKMSPFGVGGKGSTGSASGGSKSHPSGSGASSQGDAAGAGAGAEKSRSTKEPTLSRGGVE